MRYLAAATVIVLGFIALVTRLPHGPPTTARVTYSSSTATPAPPQGGEPVAGSWGAGGEAPWALSALPECFRQESQRSGPPAFARAAIPAGARRLAAGTELRVADCTLRVEAAIVRVRRGEERFYVPATARLYRDGARLVLDRTSPRGREDVRVYGPPRS